MESQVQSKTSAKYKLPGLVVYIYDGQKSLNYKTFKKFQLIHGMIFDYEKKFPENCERFHVKQMEKMYNPSLRDRDGFILNGHNYNYSKFQLITLLSDEQAPE